MARLVRVCLVIVALSVTMDGAGDSPLTRAVKDRDLNAVRTLVKSPSDVNARSGDGSTPLLWAAHNLERIADRATNICERVVYLVTGRMEEINVSKY